MEGRDEKGEFRTRYILFLFLFFAMLHDLLDLSSPARD